MLLLLTLDHYYFSVTFSHTKLTNLLIFSFLQFFFRRVNISIRFGNDLSDAIQVLDEECFTIPASLNELEIIWTEYNMAQEKIKTCQNVVGLEFFSIMVFIC